MNRRDILKTATAGALLLPCVAGARGYDFYFTRLRYESGDWNADTRVPRNVLHALRRFTSMRVDPVARAVALSDATILAAPFCYLSGHKLVQFSPVERAHFERYVRGGGFVFVDDGNHDVNGLFARSFDAELARMFGPKALRRVPHTHPLYSSFFRFDGAPSTATVELEGKSDDPAYSYLRGVEMNGRLRVLYSNKDYSGEWDREIRTSGALDASTIRFAVNIIQYALGA